MNTNNSSAVVLVNATFKNIGSKTTLQNFLKLMLDIAEAST